MPFKPTSVFQEIHAASATSQSLRLNGTNMFALCAVGQAQRSAAGGDFAQRDRARAAGMIRTQRGSSDKAPRGYAGGWLGAPRWGAWSRGVRLLHRENNSCLPLALPAQDFPAVSIGAPNDSPGNGGRTRPALSSVALLAARRACPLRQPLRSVLLHLRPRRHPPHAEHGGYLQLSQ